MKKNLAILIGDISRSAGTERAVTNLCNMLVKYGGYNVTILSCFSSNTDVPFYSLKKEVIVVHLGLCKESKIRKIISYIKIVFMTNKIIKQKSIDILLGTTHAFNTLTVFTSKFVKKIACEHMSYEACPTFSKKIRKVCYSFLDAVVLLTNADAIHYNFIKPNKVFVIPNSLSFIPEEPAKLQNKRIIAVGRLTRQKGFDILIKIASMIKNDLLDWRIDIFGDGEDKNQLLSQIREGNLDDFVYINEPTSEIEKELLDSSIYVMTSRWEGLPMILLEAKSCGLPIISFDCPEGPADVIKNDEDGFLVDTTKEKLFSEKIVYLCENDDKRLEFGNKSYLNSRDYLPVKIFEKWDTLFNSL